MRNGTARREFPDIQIHNIMTLATRVRIQILRVTICVSSILMNTEFNVCDLVVVLVSFLYNIVGHHRRLSQAASRGVSDGDAIYLASSDSGALGQDPQGHGLNFCRGCVFATVATSNWRVTQVIILTLYRFNSALLLWVGSTCHSRKSRLKNDCLKYWQLHL